MLTKLTLAFEVTVQGNELIQMKLFQRLQTEFAPHLQDILKETPIFNQLTHCEVTLDKLSGKINVTMPSVTPVMFQPFKDIATTLLVQVCRPIVKDDLEYYPDYWIGQPMLK